MATITISTAGGNWNATGTWVGGVLPVLADTILGVTGSGPLTMNVAAQITKADFSQGYTSTLTLNSTLTCGVNLTFSTINLALALSSGMTIAGGSTANYLSVFPGRSAQNQIRTNGKTIPFFGFQQNNNQSNIELLDDLTCGTFIYNTGNGNTICNGFQINLTNFFCSGAGGGSIGRLNGTTKIFINGANCTWNTSAVFNVFNPVGLAIFIDTPGTFGITGGIQVNPFGATGSGITYLQGTVTGDKNLRIWPPSAVSGVNTIYTVNLNGIGTWDQIAIANNTGTLTSTLDLTSNLNFTNMYIMPQQMGLGDNINVIFTATSRSPIIFRGAGALKGGAIYTSSQQMYQYPNNTATTRLSLSAEIRLTPGVTHSASYLSSMGGGTSGQFSPVFVRSATGGTKATLNLSGDQGVFYTNFTDINASGGNTIYTFGGTASNSDNIQTITSYVPTSAATFVN